jgi:tetratricopeptide (TPR) repeat protein
MSEQRRNVVVRLAEPVEETASAPREESSPRFWLGLVSLCVLAVLPAVGALTSRKPLPLDDVHFTNLGVIKAAEGFAKIWLSPSVSPQYLPLTYTTHWLEHVRQFRDVRRDPPLQLARTVNAGLHVVNVVLLWLLLRRLNLPGAWLATALFATVPVQVETVTWVSQRPVLLGSLFMLLCAHVFVRFADVVPETAEDGSSWHLPNAKWLLGGLCVLVYALALLSGTLALSLPIVLLVLSWWKRGEVPRGSVWLLTVLSGMSALWTALHWYRGIPGTVLPGGSPSAALLHALAVPWRYLGDVLVPWRLGFAEERSDFSWLWWVGAAMTLVVLCCTLAFRSRLGRSAFAGAALFIVLLAPGLGWVSWPYMRLADYAMHVSYLAVVPAAASVGWLAWRTMQSRHAGEGVAPAFAGVAMAIVGSAGVASGLLSRDYSDVTSLVDRQARLFPHSATAKLQQARLELKSEKPNLIRAETLLREALANDPDSVPVLLDLAGVFEARKDYERALGVLSRAERIEPTNPDVVFRTALIEAERGRSSIAKPMLERLRQRDDLSRELRLNVINILALLCQQRGELDEAERLYQQAIELDPRFPALRINYANLLYSMATRSKEIDQTRLELAVKQLETVLEFDERNWVVWLNAGAMAGALGDLGKAERFMRIAVSLRPDSVEGLRNLGQVLVMRGQAEREPFIRAKLLGDAVFVLRRASELQPNSSELRQLLEQAEKLAAQGRGG